MTEIKYEEKRLAKSGQTKKLVIMLHGVGSNSNDLISLADYLNLNQYTTYLSPNAPYEYDMAPTGYQWFSLRDYSEKVLYSAISQEAHILDKYIDEKLNEYNLEPKDLIVLGFSQGSMIALYQIPRRHRPINAIIAISGALFNPAALKEEQKSKPDIFLIHGDRDQVVPFAAFNDAIKNLKQFEFKCNEFVMVGTGHNISTLALSKIESFLKERDFI